MTLIIQKYGGSSVGTIDRINKIAKKVSALKKQGHDIVIVVSAMYGETDRLIHLAHALTHHPDPREYDMLLSTGEQVSMSLLSIALNAQACPARSFTGLQIGICTDDTHTKAHIVEIKTHIIERELQKGQVVIVAGFQGMNKNGDITTLGRGGSDTTAVALAIALNAAECQIYTDVDGVYTTDPHLIKNACLLPHISFEEMLEMASLGAKVLQMRSVELASKYNMPIRVLSTFSEGPGTLVTYEDITMPKRLISGIAFSKEEAVISLSGLPHKLGVEGYILDKMSKAHIDIDMIAQNTTAQDNIDLTFTVHRKEYLNALEVIEAFGDQLGRFSLKTNPKVAKLSLIGIGMRSHTGVASTMFQSLAHAGIQIQMITTSEIKISVIINELDLNRGVEIIHNAFKLNDVHEIESEKTLESYGVDI